MRSLLWIFFAGLVCLQGAALSAQSVPGLADDQCIVCHSDVDAMPSDHASYDVHMRKGLSCAGCHGGDPTSDDMDVAMSVEAGYVGVPTPAEIPSFCGKCHSSSAFMRSYQPRIHTDQVSQYYVSGHGMRLRQGDTNVATCTGCHSTHRILGAQDRRSSVHALNVAQTCNGCHGDTRRMAQYDIPTNQFEAYAASVHGIKVLVEDDLNAPVCNDCHGNHGALPPEAASIDEVCGSCHANNLEYFQQSLMSAPYETGGKHACVECHGYHDVAPAHIDMVGVGPGSVCTRCHEAGDPGYRVAELLHSQILGLVARYDSAAVQMQTVQRLGMDDVEISYLLQEAHQSLIHARTLVHTMDADRLAEKTNEGLRAIDQALDLAYTQIYAERNRRIGFGIATLFTTLLAIGLYLKIRQIEANQRASA